MGPFGALSRALSHRDARIFFSASLTAWTGLWMHRIAVMWLAWELTRSAFWVGMVAFCDLAPAVVFGPIAGAVADRMNRVKLTMIAQAVIGAQALGIAILTWTGVISITSLLSFEVIGGIAASFAQPARQALMPGLVPRADLPAAVACNSLCFNVARFLGPAIAGPMVALWGVGAVEPVAPSNVRGNDNVGDAMDCRARIKNRKCMARARSIWALTFAVYSC
ncbi:MAG: MFS transporter [Roseococcus sp.]